MKRLFAFGCSFTGYGCPTWADIIGQSFDYYENWGKSGIGNYLISSRVVECDSVNKITKDDVVMVMFTSIPRIDFYNGNWCMNGNIYNSHSKPYEDEWRNNNWSFTQGFYNTWIAIKQTKTFLESIGCEYKFMRAFDISPSLGHEINDFEFGMHEEKFFDAYTKEIDYYFGSEPTMLNWLNKTPYPLYKFKKAGNLNNWVDYHPTIKHHEEWCSRFLSEYYTNKLDWQEIENNMPLDDNSLILTHDFRINRKSGNVLLQ